MADDQTSQQTRVLLVNGQTIILQGDAGDNSINEINADLLQQALQEVSTTSEDAVDENNDYTAPIPETEDANDNLVAIFQGDQGETHTIQLTVEQAEALGLHFSVDNDDKPIHNDLSDHATENMYMSDEPPTHLVYPDETKQNTNEVMFKNELGGNTACTDMVQNRDMENEQVLESGEGMGMLPSSVNALISEQNQPITLIPQFVDGQMTYTVKIQSDQDEDGILQNRQFGNIDSELKTGPSRVSLQQTNVGVTLNNISSFITTPITSVNCSASTSASISYVQSMPTSTSSVHCTVSLPISSGQQTVSLPVSSVQPVNLPLSSVQQPVSAPVSSVQQTVNNYQCSRTSGTNISTDKQTKVSYVILPGNNTSTCSSVTTKLSNTPIGRLSTPFVSSRSQSLLNHNNILSSSLKTVASLPVVLSAPSANIPSTQTVTGTNTSFTGIPIAGSNTNAISTSLLTPVTSTSAPSGMIRVVAAGTQNRNLQPVINNTTTKYTSMLTPSSGRLIANTGITTAPKIVSISPASVSKAPTTTTPEVSNMVSAALTRMPVTNFNSTKPLGSSENPIQLVQHGQTFHSVQSLTQEQLRQIATVLQQQHLESAPRTKNVVYDAETNTRIIYRVVYPEDLDLRDPRSPDSKGASLNTSSRDTGSGRGRGRRGRPPKSNPKGSAGRGTDGNSGRRVGVNSGSVDMDFDEDRLILDDTTKGERKKQLARTRSGRLSRPPRHMVKDYKRLHHLDFADADLDDSDGGYSDYQMSEHETEEPTEKTDGKELLPGLAVTKRKISSHFRCPTCQKIYLGYSRMSRHFEMYPDHGSIEQLQVPNRTSNSNSSNNNNNNNDDELPTNSEPNETTKVGMTVRTTGFNGMVRTGPNRRRGKRRGPWSYTTPEARSQKRKGKLREILATCEASELAEVAGPAVAGVLSLWDLLLLRVEAARTEESYVVTLCDELQALLEKVRSVASEILKPLDVKVENKEHQLELQDELLCTTLGVASGTYLVDDSKLQRMSGGREPRNEPPVKRARLNIQDKKVVESEGTKSGSVVMDHDEMEVCNVNSRDDCEVTKNREIECPEVLSALTLVAKSSVDHGSMQDSSFIPTRTSGDDDPKVVDSVTKSDDFLLSTESNDICAKLTSESIEDSENSDTRLQQSEHSTEFSNSEQHTQDLQTVDDIVNERLKNLTSGSSLVDFSVAAPMNVVSSCMTTSTIDVPKSSIVSSQDLIDRLGQFRSLRLANDMTGNAVSSFDPEMALAAMGEGEQDSVNTSNQHFPSTLQQMETVPSDSGSSFDPEVALAAMGEGEQTSVDSQRTRYQQIENVSNNSAFTPEAALAAMGEGEQNRQFQNALPQIGSITNSSRSSFDPEMALAAMGEGEQLTNGGPTENQFQSTLTQIRIDDMTDNTGTPFDPEVALAAISEGGTSGVNEMQNQFSAAGTISGNSRRPYNSGINLHAISDSDTASKSSSHCTENMTNVNRFNSQCTENVTVTGFETQCTENVTVSRFDHQCTDNVTNVTRYSPQCTENVTNVTRFDPEMALAAMGEGPTISTSESTHIPYQSPIQQSSTSNEPGSSFDPEIALVAIGEGQSVQTATASQRSHSEVAIVNSGSFQLQCTPDLGLADASMDVSLDESGPELDFEVLSEEFNRNTRHR